MLFNQERGSKTKFPGAISDQASDITKEKQSFNSVLLDPSLFEMKLGNEIKYDIIDIFSTLVQPHSFSNFTLLDNYNAANLVNSKSLLDAGSFILYKNVSDFVEIGTSAIPIISRGKHIFKNVLNGVSGPNTEDLTLYNICIVEGFHVNIISEARLREAGVWYSGLDCILRYGIEHNNVIIKTLIHQFNLVIFKFKPISNYLILPEDVSISSAGIMTFPTLRCKIRKRFQRTREYLKP